MFEDCTWLFTNDNRNRGIIRLNFDEAGLLWRCLGETGGDILEIGRKWGGSTCLLLEGAPGRRITSIDIDPQHHPLSDQRFAKPDAADRLDLLVQDSRVRLTDRQFGFLFIDGDHSYEGVTADTQAHWNDLSATDGKLALAAFHDAVPNDGLGYCSEINHCPGVEQACRELVDAGKARTWASTGSMLVLEKRADIPDGFFSATESSG